MRRTSAISWRAIALRSMSTAPAGRIVASRREARSAESCRGAPPGCRSRSRRCSRLTARRRSAVSSSRRSESSRSTALWSSGATRERSLRCWATRATLRASMPSVLRPWPRCEHAGAGGQRRRDVDDGLAGGDELLGQQSSETAGAFDRPDALRPVSRPRSQAWRASTRRRATRSSPSVAPVSVERDGGVRALVGIDADRDHWRCSSRPTTRTDTAAGNLSSSTAVTPLSSHANGGRRPRGTL